jgi:hypothetical protein
LKPDPIWRGRHGLAQAIDNNAHVAALLLGKKKKPRQLPGYVGVGDWNEAVAYVHGVAEALAGAPDALGWLRACQP